MTAPDIKRWRYITAGVSGYALEGRNQGPAEVGVKLLICFDVPLSPYSPRKPLDGLLDSRINCLRERYVLGKLVIATERPQGLSPAIILSWLRYKKAVCVLLF